MSLRQLLYVSQPANRLGDADCADILAAARRNNARDGITGLLLYVPTRVFMQVLEGPPQAVSATLGRILRDRRHAHLAVLLDTEVAERAFTEWSMGFRCMTPSDLAGNAGFREIRGAEDLHDIGAADNGALPLRLMRQLYDANDPGRPPVADAGRLA